MLRPWPLPMSESLWEEGAVVEAEDETGVATQEPVAEPVALTVSADDFSALEERVLRAVELVKRERQQRAAAEDRTAEAEARATRAEAQLREQSPVVDQMEAELKTLKAERDHVRQRVERLLEQLDGLEL